MWFDKIFKNNELVRLAGHVHITLAMQWTMHIAVHNANYMFHIAQWELHFVKCTLQIARCQVAKLQSFKIAELQSCKGTKW